MIVDLCGPGITLTAEGAPSAVPPYILPLFDSKPERL